MDILGEAFDCAANRADMPLQEFLELFVSTGVADAFGSGSPRYVAGASGIELFLDVCYCVSVDADSSLLDDVSTSETLEYWCGWIVAYWQWVSGRPFCAIARVINMDDVLACCDPLHEASEEKFVEVMEGRARELDAPLKTTRELRDLSQGALAEASEVSLRAIYQYGQRCKNINHTRGVSLHALARALGCHIEDLFEYPL